MCLSSATTATLDSAQQNLSPTTSASPLAHQTITQKPPTFCRGHDHVVHQGCPYAGNAGRQVAVVRDFVEVLLQVFVDCKVEGVGRSGPVDGGIDPPERPHRTLVLHDGVERVRDVVVPGHRIGLQDLHSGLEDEENSEIFEVVLAGFSYVSCFHILKM